MVLVEKEIKAIYKGDVKIRPVITNTKLLHMPLENDLSDISQYNRTATSTSTPIFETVGGVSAIKGYNTSLRVNIPMTDFKSMAYTQSAWAYVSSQGAGTDWKCFWGNKSGNAYVDVTFVTNSANSSKWANFYLSDTFTTQTLTVGWHLITLTRDGDTQIIYHDGVAISTTTKKNQNYTYGSIDILRRSDYGQERQGWMSDFIVDSVAWSAADVLAYYNDNKSKYGY